MKKQLKKSLSLLLTLVMVLSLLPVAALAATAYTKAGEIGAVTAECAPIAAPTLGGEVINSFHVTVTSPTDKGLVNPTGDAVQWQRKTGDTWMDYTEESFDEGTYRLCIRLTSIARSGGNYYALVSATTLTVNGTPFTPGDAPIDSTYQTFGNASMDFYSQEYTITKEAGTYLVTVTASANGRASADKVYGKTGEVVTLTAEPYTGYRLKEWRVISGGVTVEDNQFTISTENVEIRAIFESSNENLEDIKQVEVTKKEGVDYRPIMGSTAGRIDVTIQSSTPDDDTLIVGGYGCGIWEVKQSDGRWAHFSNEPFTYGTYRMRISLRNEVVDGKYHALTKNTVLIVDGEAWAADPDSLYTYYSLADGYGMMSFVSEEMDVIPLANISDSTPARCYVKPVLGEFAVPMGDDFSFTVEPKDYYELTDSYALKVYVNDILVAPDEDGVYTVQNVTEDLDIYCDGSGFTGYSNLVISANGKTVTEKVYVGDTYTFKTLDAIGATVPSGSTFTGWKIGGKTYQPGDTYTVVGNTEIKVIAAFTGLHNITVENGKAYADAAHTIPISAAAEDQVIYIVADPAPDGKVFSYWTEIEITSPGGDGSFGNYAAAETTYTVYYSDVVLAPVYETQIDSIVINGMTKPAAGAAIDNSDYSYKWGCSVPANSGYSLGISYWYDITEGEPEFAMSSGDVFQIGHTYRFKAKINLYGDTILAAKEDISVTLNGINAEDYVWTISEYSQVYENMVICFEFTCEREEPDTSFVRPKGDGSEGNPFQITNVGELYWFAGFVNETIAADDITVDSSKVCAKLMNDITVNYQLLKDDGTVNGSSGFVYWIPIGFYSNYSGTFDGQNHTISGLLLNHPDAYAKYGEIGFVAELTSGGCIRDLTIADSLFAPPISNKEYFVGGIVGRMWAGTSVINCHFQGTIRANTTYYLHTLGGIAGCSNGTITDCTSRGWIKGYSNGGTGGIVGNTYGSGMVSGCVNYASVVNELPSTYYGGKDSAAGGIAAVLNRGTVRDCCNKGDVSGEHTWVGGIVGRAEGWENQWAYIIRCWNEGSVNYCGIAGNIYRYTTVENCYNAGTVRFGITSVVYEVDTKVLYCHNAKAETANPIIGRTAPAEIANCYYLADSELYEIDGITYKTADQFADGTVLALLNNGHWTQGEDDDYPVLGDPPTSISGTVTLTGTSAAASVTVEELSGKAILIIAQYSGDQMTAAQILAVTAEGTFTPENPFTHADGSTYKAFLVEEDSCEPLCEAALLVVQEK